MSAAAPRCGACGKQPTKNLVCSLCHEAAYCNAACQRANWPHHKKTCKGRQAQLKQQVKKSMGLGHGPLYNEAYSPRDKKLFSKLVMTRKDKKEPLDIPPLYPLRSNWGAQLSIVSKRIPMVKMMCSFDDNGKGEFFTAQERMDQQWNYLKYLFDKKREALHTDSFGKATWSALFRQAGYTPTAAFPEAFAGAKDGELDAQKCMQFAFDTHYTTRDQDWWPPAFPQKCDCCDKASMDMCYCLCGETFCNRDCHVQHWSVHKNVCTEVRLNQQVFSSVTQMWWAHVLVAGFKPDPSYTTIRITMQQPQE